MNIIKNRTIIYSLLLVVVASQFVYGESNSDDFYFSNVKDLFLKEEQTISPTLSVSPKDTTGLHRAYNHSSYLMLYYIAIPEFDNVSYEFLKFSYKSEKVPFLAFGTTVYERIGRLNPDIYSFFPLSIYVDLYNDDPIISDYFQPYLFMRYSNWGKYSNPDSIKTSYLCYGIALGEMPGNIELGVLHIDNNRFKDDFYYFRIGLDLGLAGAMAFSHQ